MALFSFTPSRPGGLEGAAFSQPFKLLTLMIIVASLGWILLGSGGVRAAASNGQGLGGSWVWAAFALMAYTGWHILRSRTRIDAQGLHQTWIWDKRMACSELVYVRLIRVRALDWLIAPRLYARSHSGRFAVFYAADAAVLQEFERLAQALDKHVRGVLQG